MVDQVRHFTKVMMVEILGLKLIKDYLDLIWVK